MIKLCRIAVFLSLLLVTDRARAELIDSGELRLVRRVILMVGIESVVTEGTASADCLADNEEQVVHEEAALLLRQADIEVVEDFPSMLLGDWENHAMEIRFDASLQPTGCLLYMSINLGRGVQMPEGHKSFAIGYSNQIVRLLPPDQVPEVVSTMLKRLIDEIRKARGK